MKVTASKTISAEADEVWRLLADFGHFYRLNPLLECSPVTNGVHHGVGAERECVFYDGSTIRERITEVRAGESLDIQITESSLPISDGTVFVRVAAEEPGRARITFDVDVTPKYGAVGGLLGLVMRPVLKSRFNLVIRGIATYLRTGQAVGPHSALIPV